MVFEVQKYKFFSIWREKKKLSNYKGSEIIFISYDNCVKSGIHSINWAMQS